MIDGFTNGFHLGIDSEPDPCPECKNARMCSLHPRAVQALVDKEVKKGHILGPFDAPPIDGLLLSPLNLVPKQGSPNQFRLIHDLKFQYNLKQSV